MNDTGSDILENNTGHEAQQAKEAAGGGGGNNSKQGREEGVGATEKNRGVPKARKAYRRLVRSIRGRAVGVAPCGRYSSIELFSFNII